MGYSFAALPVKLYPNPATDGFRLEIEQSASSPVQQVYLTDLMGREVLRLSPNSATGGSLITLRGDVSELPAGMYLVNIQTDAAVQSLKLLKK